jgi:hypothetical protein
MVQMITQHSFTLTQIQSHLDLLSHTQQEIVTKHFVELFFNDTLQYALDFLDSVIQYVPEMDSLHVALLSKYGAMSLMSVHYDGGQGNTNQSYAGITRFDAKSIEGFIKRERITPLRIQLDNQAEIDPVIETTESLFKIRPNPARSFVEIELNIKKIDSRSEYRIEIINGEGIRVYQSTKTGLNNLNINTSGWKSGIYIVIVFDQNNVIARQKLILN